MTWQIERIQTTKGILQVKRYKRYTLDLPSGKGDCLYCGAVHLYLSAVATDQFGSFQELVRSLRIVIRNRRLEHPYFWSAGRTYNMRLPGFFFFFLHA